MPATTNISLNISGEDLPYSKMEYPDAAFDKFKYAFWKLYTPYHPFFRNAFMALLPKFHDFRQPFHLGMLAPEKSAKDFVDFLVKNGYGNHFVAWKDKGEVIGLRKTDGFKNQYHIRLFEDGEICGHYEYTPECYPVWHVMEVGQEDRAAEFKEFLKDWLV